MGFELSSRSVEIQQLLQLMNAKANVLKKINVKLFAWFFLG